MPQEFHVVRCFKCEAFQVHIVKKVPKWECKICGEKQSVRQVYGKGTGKDCRLHVQKLNALRADIIPDTVEEATDEFENTSSVTCNSEPSQVKRPSKWAEFMDETNHTHENNQKDEDPTSPIPKRIKLDETVEPKRTIRSYFKPAKTYQDLSTTDSLEVNNPTNSQRGEHLDDTLNDSAETGEVVQIPQHVNKEETGGVKVFETLAENENLDSIFDIDF